MTIPISYEHYQAIHKQGKRISVVHYLRWYAQYKDGDKTAFVPTSGRGHRAHNIIFDEASYENFQNLWNAQGDQWRDRRGMR